MAITINGDGTISGVTGSVIQLKRFEPGATRAAVANFGSINQAPTTSNTTSIYTANFTPVSSTSKIYGIYQSCEDGQGTNGWTIHSCFDGSTLLGSSFRYLRYQNQEPYTQTFTFEYDHNTTSQIGFNLRYGSTAGLYIVLNRSETYTQSSGIPNSHATSLILMEVEQ